MSFDLTGFSEIVRTLSPGRFRRFMEGILDIERGYRHKPTVRGGLGTWKAEIAPSDLNYSFLRYVQSSLSGSGIIDGVTDFIITHHVPSFISAANYLDILFRDLKSLSQSDGFKRILTYLNQEYQLGPSSLVMFSSLTR